MCGGGNRSARRAQSQQIPATVVRTADRRDLDATVILTRRLTTSTPTVPHALRHVPSGTTDALTADGSSANVQLYLSLGIALRPPGHRIAHKKGV